MGMIRHQNPGEHAGVAQYGVVFKAPGGGAPGVKIIKEALAVKRSRGYQVKGTSIN